MVAVVLVRQDAVGGAGELIELVVADGAPLRFFDPETGVALPRG